MPELPVPQPKSYPVIGNMHVIDPAGPVQSLMRTARAQGPVFRLSFLGRSLLIVSSQELVAELCDDARFEKSVHAVLLSLRDLAGDGLFTAHNQEPNWGKAHRILMPAFGPFGIQRMFDQMLDIAEQLMVRWERFGEEATWDVAEQMTRLTLDTIALCGFNYRFNSFYQDDMHPFVDAMVGGLSEAGLRVRRPGLVNELLVKRQREYDERLALMHRVADELITERRKSGAVHDDLLHRMLNSADPNTGERLSDQNIRYQMVTFLVAGHETTSGLLSFAIHLLLQHPAVMARAREAVDEVLGGDKPRVDDLAKLRYIEQILLEALRLWPTAPAFGRMTRESTLLGGRYRLRANEPAMVLVPMLHRDRAVWGADAEQFKPERFDKEREAALPPHAFKPFGTGPRSCIGRPFAMQEAMLVLSMLLQRFELLAADPGYRLKIKEALTLKPDGLRIRVRRRPQLPSRRMPESTAAPSPATAGAGNSLRAPQDGPPLLVLYGSNAGTAETLAQRVAERGRALGFRTDLQPMNARAADLPHEGLLVLVTASYEGKPPDNAAAFVQALGKLSGSPLEALRFAVFGCGDRRWTRTYQAVPTMIDSMLAEAGAQPMVPRGEGDAASDMLGPFEDWLAELQRELRRRVGHVTVPPPPAPGLSVDVLPLGRAAVLGLNEMQLAAVIDNRGLVDMGASFARDKRHIELRLPEGMSYQVGDYLALLPRSPEEIVQRALARFSLAADAQVTVQGEGYRADRLPLGRPVSAAELLSDFVELSQPATRSQLQQLMEVTACPPERSALLALIERESFERNVSARRVSVLDLLEQYPSCGLSLSAFLGMLPALQPRTYSIASSPRQGSATCALTVSVVSAPALSGQGNFFGVASHYLSRCAAGMRLPVLVQSGKPEFRPPTDPHVPMILICAGSGLAPFRGFLQDRAAVAASGEQVACCLLFFGCDHPDVDFLYREELLGLAAAGVVDVRPAFFQAPEGDVRFVQHRLYQDRKDALELYEQGATVYVCGDGTGMAPAVRATWGGVLAEQQGAPAEAAEALVCAAEEAQRYVVDVFQ